RSAARTTPRERRGRRGGRGTRPRPGEGAAGEGFRKDPGKGARRRSFLSGHPERGEGSASETPIAGTGHRLSGARSSLALLVRVTGRVIDQSREWMVRGSPLSWERGPSAAAPSRSR